MHTRPLCAVLAPSVEAPRISTAPPRFDKLETLLKGLLPPYHNCNNPLVLQKSKAFKEAYDYLNHKGDDEEGDGDSRGGDDAGIFEQNEIELFGGGITYAEPTQSSSNIASIYIASSGNDDSYGDYDISKLVDSTRRANEHSRDNNSKKYAFLGNLFGETDAPAKGSDHGKEKVGKKQYADRSDHISADDTFSMYGSSYTYNLSQNDSRSSGAPPSKKARAGSEKAAIVAPLLAAGRAPDGSSTWKKNNECAFGSLQALFAEKQPAASKAKPNPKSARAASNSKAASAPSLAEATVSKLDANIAAAIEKCAVNVGNVCGMSEARGAIARSASTNGRMAIALVWSDGALSSSMSTTSQKFCTPSVGCHRWNCTCDRNIRVDRASTVFGAVFLLSDDPNSMYFLPLGDLSGDISTGFDDGSASLDDRWHFLFGSILACSILKVVYNSQLVMLPVASKLMLSGKMSCNLANIFDPKVAAFTCNSDLTLEKLELSELFALFDVSFEWPAKSGYAEVDFFVCIRKELSCLLHLHKALHSRLKSINCLEVFSKVEGRMPLLLAKMELQGLSIDKQKFSAIEAILHKEIAAIETSAHEAVGRPFNLSSPLEVSGILYDYLHLETSKKTKGGRHGSTSEDALAKLVTKHPVVQLILNHRGMSKLLGTFIDGYRPFLRTAAGAFFASPPAINSNSDEATSKDKDKELNKMKNFFSVRVAPSKSAAAVAVHDDSSGGSSGVYKVHAQWNQLSTRTGRMSCSKPNLQQIPNNQLIGSQALNMRSIVRGCGRRYLVAADYSQIEIRVLAHFSRDETLRQFFERTAHCVDGGDVYRALAAKINKTTEELVTKVQRNDAKVIALGVIYGMSAYGVMGLLDSDMAVATKISEEFLNSFPSIRSYLQSVKTSARRDGFVTTLFGRKRFLPGINSSVFSVRAQAERQAVNSVIQGSAADIQKFAMIYVDQEIEERYGGDPRRPCLLLQIHDELIYEIEGPCDESEEAHKEWLRDECAPFVAFLRKRLDEGPSLLGLKVPLASKVSVGRNWADMEEVVDFNEASNTIVLSQSSQHSGAKSQTAVLSIAACRAVIDFNVSPTYGDGEYGNDFEYEFECDDSALEDVHQLQPNTSSFAQHVSKNSNNKYETSTNDMSSGAKVYSLD